MTKDDPQNYDATLVEEYLAGSVSLEDLTAATGRMPLGWASTTRFVAMMSMLERIDRKV